MAKYGSMHKDAASSFMVRENKLGRKSVNSSSSEVVNLPDGKSVRMVDRALYDRALKAAVAKMKK